MTRQQLSVQGSRRSMALVSPRPSDLGGAFFGTQPDLLLVCEGGPDAVTLAKERCLDVYSLEEAIMLRRRWRASDLEVLLNHFPDALNGCRVLPYAVVGSLSRAGVHSRLIDGISLPLKRLLDDKHQVRTALSKADIPVPRHMLVSQRARIGESIGYDMIAKSLGLPFVVQPIVGSAGVGTMLVRDLVGYQEALATLGPNIVVSELVGTRTINVHAIVSAHGVTVCPATLQLTGIAGVVKGWGEYCGSSILAEGDVDKDAYRRIQMLTLRVGRLLARMKYRGVFGVDIATGEDFREAHVLEINPRFQASTGLIDQELASLGLATIVQRHIEVFNGLSHAYLDEMGRKTTMLLVNAEHECYVREVAASGLYSLEGRSEVYLRRLARHDVRPQNSLIVQISGAPGFGTHVMEGATFLRIFCPSAEIASPDGRSLTEQGRLILGAAKRLVVQCVTREKPCQLQTEEGPHPTRVERMRR